MNSRKIVLSIIGVLLIIGSFFGAKYIINSKNTPKPRPEKVVKTVIVETVKNGNVPIIVPANGNLVAKRRVEIYAEVQGIFKPGKKLFKPGQEYRAGEILIQIDAAEYYANVQSSKSNLYNLITSIMPDLRLDYPEVFNKWQTFLANFDINKSVPPLPEMSTEKEKYFISGRGILTNYYSTKNLEQRLAKYTIAAPFTGVLTEALVTEGTLVRSGQKLGEFINTSDYELEVAISKTYSDLLKVGEVVALKSIDQAKTYKGKVARINGRVDLTSQTITAFIEVNDPDLREGMYLEANLTAREESDAIEVNRSLLLENDQIFVVRDSVLDLIPVSPVYFSNSKVVLKNVPDGLTILSKPVMGAYSGMLVKVFQDPETNNKD